MSEAKIVLTAEDKTKAAFDRVRAGLGGIGDSASTLSSGALSSLLPQLTAAAAAFASISTIRGAIDAADHLNDLSKATGIAVSTLGGLGFAASQAGTDLDGAAASMGKLNLAIAKAAAGDSGTAAAFEAIGVSVRSASGAIKTADQIFSEVATSLARYADGPNKAAIANVLFGKSYASILPLLADGGQALQDNIAYYERFGGVTKETAEAADKFNDTLGKIGLIGGSLGRSLAEGLLPTLQAVADEILRLREGSNGFGTAVSAMSTAMEAISILGANVAFVLAAIGREIGAVAAQTAALANLDVKGFHAISDAVKEDGVRARKELDDFERRILLRLNSTAGAGRGFVNPALLGASANKPDAPGLPGSTAQQRDKFAEYLQSLKDAQRALVEYSREEQTVYDISIGKIGKLTKAQKELLIVEAQRADKFKALFSAEMAQDAISRRLASDASFAEHNKAADDAINGFAGRTAEALRIAQTARLEMRLAAGELFTPEELDRIVKGIAGIGDKLQETADDWTVFAEQAARNIQDALGNTLEATLSGNFDSIGRMWKSLIIRMASEAAAAQIGKALFGDFGKTGQMGGYVGDFLKLLPTLLASSKGNAFGNGVHAFASGGILGSGGGLLTQPTLFPMANGGIGIGGEAGTEAILPLRRGANGKLGVEASGGGGGVVLSFPTNIHIDARTDQAQVAQAVAAGMQQTERRMWATLKARGMA